MTTLSFRIKSELSDNALPSPPAKDDSLLDKSAELLAQRIPNPKFGKLGMS
jgi:hypothetical protein